MNTDGTVMPDACFYVGVHEDMCEEHRCDSDRLLICHGYLFRLQESLQGLCHAGKVRATLIHNEFLAWSIQLFTQK